MGLATDSYGFIVLELEPIYDKIERKFHFIYLIKQNNKYGLISGVNIVLKPVYNEIKIKEIREYHYQITADGRKGHLINGKLNF